MHHQKPEIVWMLITWMVNVFLHPKLYCLHPSWSAHWNIRIFNLHAFVNVANARSSLDVELLLYSRPAWLALPHTPFRMLSPPWGYMVSPTYKRLLPDTLCTLYCRRKRANHHCQETAACISSVVHSCCWKSETKDNANFSNDTFLKSPDYP